jgi:hypothetical protein
MGSLIRKMPRHPDIIRHERTRDCYGASRAGQIAIGAVSGEWCW